MNFLRRFVLQGKKNLLTARVSMLLKSRASLTRFRACFLPGRTKDLSARRYIKLFGRPSSNYKCRHLQRLIMSVEQYSTRLEDKQPFYRFLGQTRLETTTRQPQDVPWMTVVEASSFLATVLFASSRLQPYQSL